MNFVVTTAHRSNYPDPDRLSPGNRVTLGRRDVRYPGCDPRDNRLDSRYLSDG